MRNTCMFARTYIQWPSTYVPIGQYVVILYLQVVIWAVTLLPGHPVRLAQLLFGTTVNWYSVSGSSPLKVHGLVQFTLFPTVWWGCGAESDGSGCDWRRIGRLLPGNSDSVIVVVCNSYHSRRTQRNNYKLGKRITFVSTDKRLV